MCTCNRRDPAVDGPLQQPPDRIRRRPQRHASNGHHPFQQGLAACELLKRDGEMVSLANPVDGGSKDCGRAFETIEEHPLVTGSPGQSS